MINNNILALILSFVMVFLIIGLAELFKKLNWLGDEGSRKFIHIGVSNWWFLMMFLFDNIYIAIIAPIAFIVLNYVSYKTNLIKSMERSGNGNLGTVYFPISLLLMVIFSFIVKNPLFGGIGILVLGYGDGFAAVVGKKFGSKKLFKEKSYLGTITMFVAAFLVTVLMMVGFNFTGISNALLIALAVGVVASIVELFTPKGLDNISIPLVVSLFVYLISLGIM